MQARVNLWRSHLRAAATAAIVDAYHLRDLTANALVVRLDSLLTRADINYNFIFPETQDGKFDYERIFLRPIFTQILFQTFFGHKKIAQQEKEWFRLPSSANPAGLAPQGGEYEMAAPLLALAVTDVEC